MPELLRVRVSRRRILAEGVVGLTLVGVDGPLPAWTPGAHVDVVLPSGLVRQYSLCGSPSGRDRYEIAVLREVAGRGGSVEVHERVTAGAELRITRPKNRFPLVSADRYLFVAGGIGITPILPMIEAVGMLDREWHFVYGGRTRGSMAFLDHLDLLDLAGDRVEVVPQDECGILDLPGILAARPDAVVYACGPAPMLDAVQEQAARTGRGPVHVERFVGSVRPDRGPVARAAAAAKAFEVQLGHDGPVVDVPVGVSILEAVLASGARPLFSCEEGTCGSCETLVLAGEVEHRDVLLTDDERSAGLMLICVSRARSPRLVLEIAGS